MSGRNDQVVGGGGDVPLDVVDRKSEVILDAVVALIEERGYQGFELRSVAQAARVSLETIYKRFRSRDVLLAAAAERWMRANVFPALRRPDPAGSVSDRLVAVFRQIHEPFVQHPRMLEVVFLIDRATGSSGNVFGSAAHAGPFVDACFGENVDAGYVRDVKFVLAHVAYSLLTQFASGQLTAHEVLQGFEIASRRLAAVADMALSS